MSYVDIFTDYESNKLALGMLADAPLETFLREHPQITSIRFCLDRDEPGRKAAAELMRKYYELGYEVEDCPPPAGYKDYNEWLVAAKLNLNRMNKRADEDSDDDEDEDEEEEELTGEALAEMDFEDHSREPGRAGGGDKG